MAVISTKLKNALFRVFISWQMSLQSQWKPASWLKFCKAQHSEDAQWTFANGVTMDAAIDAVWNAAEEIEGYYPKSSLVVIEDGKETTRVVINILTKGAKWMDQITIDFDRSNNTAKLRAESTGFLPLAIPFACFINLFFFWFPFQDTLGKCGKEMHVLLRQTELALGGGEGSGKECIQARTTRYSRSNPRRHDKKPHSKTD